MASIAGPALEGIPTIKDRIVQESIKLILESIYEPCFNTIPFQNYGFRPNKSTHDAIEFIKNNGTANNIALEGDIKGAFDNVDHKILIKILNKKIKDQKFLKRGPPSKRNGARRWRALDHYMFYL